MWAFILICFEQSHNGRTLLGHLVYLSSCFRDEKPEAKKGSHSKLSGWWVAGAPEVLPPVPSQLIVLSTLLLVLRSALLASVQQV